MPFSFSSNGIKQRQVPCHITYTNKSTHEIIQSGIHRSPIYSGAIKSRGRVTARLSKTKLSDLPTKRGIKYSFEPEGLDTS